MTLHSDFTGFYLQEQEEKQKKGDADVQGSGQEINDEGHAPETEQEASGQEQEEAQEKPEDTEVVNLSDNTDDGPDQQQETQDDHNANDLSEYTVDELKDMAKDAGIDAYYDMKKAELVEALEGLNG